MFRLGNCNALLRTVANESSEAERTGLSAPGVGGAGRLARLARGRLRPGAYTSKGYWLLPLIAMLWISASPTWAANDIAELTRKDTPNSPATAAQLHEQGMA